MQRHFLELFPSLFMLEEIGTGFQLIVRPWSRSLKFQFHFAEDEDGEDAFRIGQVELSAARDEAERRVGAGKIRHPIWSRDYPIYAVCEEASEPRNIIADLYTAKTTSLLHPVITGAGQNQRQTARKPARDSPVRPDRYPGGMKPVFLLTLSLWSVAIAQTNYVQTGPIGQPAAPVVSAAPPCPVEDRATLPLKCWAGRKILIRPLPLSNQKNGYPIYSKKSEFWGRIPYQDLAGKQATITKVFKNSFGTFTVQMEIADSGIIVYGETLLGMMENIAFIRDLDSASKALIGKSLWLRERNLSTVDATGDKLGRVETGRLAKVTVTNVVAASNAYSYRPVRVIAKTQDGRSGFIDISWSGTNAPQGYKEIDEVGYQFFNQDPRSLYSFPEEQWTAIEHSQVIAGMNADAVLLAFNWKPDHIIVSTSGGVRKEQWVFDSGFIPAKYVSLENGIVTSVK